MKKKKEVPDYVGIVFFVLAFIVTYFLAFDLFNRQEYYLQRAQADAKGIAVVVSSIVLCIYLVIKKLITRIDQVKENKKNKCHGNR